MNTSLYKTQYEAAESELVKTNALIDDYNHELYERNRVSEVKQKN